MAHRHGGFHTGGRRCQWVGGSFCCGWASARHHHVTDNRPSWSHPARFMVAIGIGNGSYICAGSSASLTAWSTSGNVLFTRTGDYSHAKLFAGPGSIQIALGPAGTAVVETVSVPDGSSSVGATFSGSFNTWFLDGSRFLTNLSNGVWMYDIHSVQQSFAHSRYLSHRVGKETGCGRLSLILRQLPFIRSELECGGIIQRRRRWNGDCVGEHDWTVSVWHCKC